MRFFQTTKTKQLQKKYPTDAGYDVCCAEDFTIEPGETKMVKTGLYLEIPVGYFGLLTSRSGIASEHAIEVGSGTIDSQYRGEIRVILHNFGKNSVCFKDGNRIAQLVIIPCGLDKPSAVTDFEFLSQTARGDKGLGSTGI